MYRLSGEKIFGIFFGCFLWRWRVNMVIICIHVTTLIYLFVFVNLIKQTMTKLINLITDLPLCLSPYTNLSSFSFTFLRLYSSSLFIHPHTHTHTQTPDSISLPSHTPIFYRIISLPHCFNPPLSPPPPLPRHLSVSLLSSPPLHHLSIIFLSSASVVY